MVLDHFLVKLVHGSVPLGNGSSRRRGGCRLDFLNISTVRVNADRLGSHVKGYTEIDGLANVAQLDIVVALDFVGCHADFLAVHSDTLVGRLGGRAGYGSICNSGQLRCSAHSADLDSARVLVPVHAKACQLANIAQLEIVVVVDVVSGRVHTGRANINSLSLGSGRHSGQCICCTCGRQRCCDYRRSNGSCENPLGHGQNLLFNGYQLSRRRLIARTSVTIHDTITNTISAISILLDRT